MLALLYYLFCSTKLLNQSNRTLCSNTVTQSAVTLPAIHSPCAPYGVKVHNERRGKIRKADGVTVHWLMKGKGFVHKKLSSVWHCFHLKAAALSRIWSSTFSPFYKRFPFTRAKTELMSNQWNFKQNSWNREPVWIFRVYRSIKECALQHILKSKSRPSQEVQRYWCSLSFELYWGKWGSTLTPPRTEPQKRTKGREENLSGSRDLQ